MINPRQLRDEVVRPTLQAIDLWSEAAEVLVLGTAMHESRLTYIRQIRGPALGLWQIEPETHRDVWASFLAFRPALARAVLDAAKVRTKDASPFRVPHEPLIWNLAYGAAICRILYRRVKDPLPAADDWRGLAEYWKRFYNTAAGAGTEAQFVASTAAIRTALES